MGRPWGTVGGQRSGEACAEAVRAVNAAEKAVTFCRGYKSLKDEGLR